MDINDLKFNSNEFIGQDVSDLPDNPSQAGLSANDLKERFDNVGKAMLALGRYNKLIDALKSGEGAENIGLTSAGGVQTNVRQNLNQLWDAMGEAGYGDMLKAEYDTSGNGKVDRAENADALGGVPAGWYQPVQARFVMSVSQSIPTAPSPVTLLFDTAEYDDAEGGISVENGIFTVSEELREKYKYVEIYATYGTTNAVTDGRNVLRIMHDGVPEYTDVYVEANSISNANGAGSAGRVNHYGRLSRLGNFRITMEHNSAGALNVYHPSRNTHCVVTLSN